MGFSFSKTLLEFAISPREQPRLETLELDWWRTVASFWNGSYRAVESFVVCRNSARNERLRHQKRPRDCRGDLV